jgi:putative intracellular protease/amidase
MAFTIGMLIFDNMTNLDFAGPADVFARVADATTVVLAKTTDAVRTDSGGRVLPDMALRDAPELDLLFVGGGPGTLALMEDARFWASSLKEHRARSGSRRSARARSSAAPPACYAAIAQRRIGTRWTYCLSSVRSR